MARPHVLRLPPVMFIQVTDVNKNIKNPFIAFNLYKILRLLLMLSACK